MYACAYNFCEETWIGCGQYLLLTGSLDGTLLVWELPQQLVFQTIAATRLRSHSKRVSHPVTGMASYLEATV
jgi:hypothetical protein